LKRQEKSKYNGSLSRQKNINIISEKKKRKNREKAHHTGGYTGTSAAGHPVKKYYIGKKSGGFDQIR
jgi:hypothetical protein